MGHEIQNRALTFHMAARRRVVHHQPVLVRAHAEHRQALQSGRGHHPFELLEQVGHDGQMPGRRFDQMTCNPWMAHLECRQCMLELPLAQGAVAAVLADGASSISS